MKTNRIYGTALFMALRTYPKPSEFILYISQLKLGTLVVLYIRVSSRQQRDKLPHQLRRLKMEAERLGLKVIAVCCEIVPGWERADWERWGRGEFERAVAIAKDAGAVVVAETVDRFRRSYDRHRKPGQPQRPLDALDMMWLMNEADGVPLATLVHPDAPPEQVRREQSKRGQEATGNYGGRPKTKFPKKARRERLMPEALRLWEEGYSYRQIGAQLKVPWGTVKDWIKRKKSTHP